MSEDDKYEVLIVDDIPKNIQVISSILTEEEIEVSFATNGKQALDNVKFKPPDLILLDIAMPGMDGYEVCTKIKQMDSAKHVPIIFLTAKTEVEDIVQGFDTGAVDYITKPFNSRELISRVFTHLELKRSRDLIEQKTKTIEKQNEELKYINATKDKFFSVISHDLKNPFHVIVGYSKLLIKEAPKHSDKTLEKYASTVVDAARSGSKLLENLLHWSRSQRGAMECAPKMLALHRIVKSAVDYLKQDIENKRIDLQVDVANDILVWADDRMLNSVVRNLLSNAIKFTNEYGQVVINAIKHHHNITDSKSFVLISVKDNGIGIPKDDISKLFRLDKNYTRIGTKNEKGTGLGLILCKEFIEKNNGKIWVESEHKVGSTFFFSLPLYNKQDINAKGRLKPNQ